MTFVTESGGSMNVVVQNGRSNGDDSCSPTVCGCLACIPLKTVLFHLVLLPILGVVMRVLCLILGSIMDMLGVMICYCVANTWWK